MKFLLSDFWHVLLFPKDFHLRGDSENVKKKLGDHQSDPFFEKYHLNEELLSFYSELKKKHGLNTGIFSSGTLFKAPELKRFLDPVFSTGFSSNEIRFEKNKPDAYRYLCTKLEVLPSELIFIDDSPENTKSANLAGVKAVQYRNNEQVIKEISFHF